MRPDVVVVRPALEDGAQVGAGEGAKVEDVADHGDDVGVLEGESKGVI